jgi:hypothetical protein
MLGNVCGTVGSIVTVPIIVSNTTGQNIISYDLNIDYDPTIVQPATPPFDVAGTLSSTMSITPNASNSGHLIISAFQGTPISGAGTLINLRFTIVGTAGQTSPLTFTDYTDPGMNFHPGFVFNEGDPVAITTNGSICVSPSAISGRVLTSDGRGIRNAKIVVTGNSLSQPIVAATGAFGQFALDGLAMGETYVVTVNSQRFTFTSPSRVISLVDSFADANFIADPQE